MGAVNQMEDKYRKTARNLSIIWVVSYVLLGIISNIYTIYQRAINDYNPVTMLSGYQLLSLIIMLLYFIPMLFVICRYSKLAHMKKLNRIASIVCVFISIWSVMLFVLTIVSFCYPGII